jgi:hypothetical protein
MVIKLKREGGFTGIPANKSVNSTELSDEELTAFNKAVENPPAPNTDAQERGLQARDVCNYEIKVKKGNKTVTIKYDDTTIPEHIYMMFQKHL